jgi:hypothetical protein
MTHALGHSRVPGQVDGQTCEFTSKLLTWEIDDHLHDDGNGVCEREEDLRAIVD